MSASRRMLRLALASAVVASGLGLSAGAKAENSGPASTSASRTETQAYVGGTEGLFPGSLCGGSAPGVGATCFIVDPASDRSVGFSITDAVTAKVAGEWRFQGDQDPFQQQSVGDFCGSIDAVAIPSWAVRVWVSVLTARSSSYCPQLSAATSGTVTANFYS